MTMRRMIAIAALSLSSACAGNASAGQYTCSIPGSTCIDFVSGWTEDSARVNCDTVSTFATGSSCPSGRIAHCTLGLGTGIIVTSYYANFGDGSVYYAQTACAASHGDFSAP